jgi:DNA-binding transcriptional regulator/RsmH inhibitor MraZ
MDDFFIGSALSSIGVRGYMPLHDAFCITIQSRAANDHLFVGLHDEAQCMVVYDRAGVAERHRRERERQGDDDIQANEAARRRAFGFVAPTKLDGQGRISIAPWMRSKRGVAQRTLLVGMGDHFEIWNLDYVLEHGPADLAMLATLHMTPPSNTDDRHAPALHLVSPPRRTRHAGESGFPVQQVPALQSRSGLVAVGAA